MVFSKNVENVVFIIMQLQGKISFSVNADPLVVMESNLLLSTRGSPSWVTGHVLATHSSMHYLGLKCPSSVA